MYKVLIFTDCYIYGGSERLMSFLIRNPVIKANFEVTLSYRKHKIYEEGVKKEYADLPETSFLHPVSILSNYTLFYKINSSRLPKLVKNALKAPFYLLRKLGIYFIYNLISHIINLKKNKPDVIHINNGGYPGAVSCNTMVIAAKLLGHKNIIYQVNNIAQPAKSVFEKAYDRFVYKNVSYFITASAQAKNQLILQRQFNPAKVIQLFNTVADENANLSRVEILNSLSISQDNFVIAVVAFLSKRKGQYYLLKALEIIKKQNFEIFKKISVLLIGDGEEEHFLKNFVLESELANNVSFLGYQSQSINYIEACNLFVLPSITGEDMPLVVLTAMSKGKSILATDYAGIREEIEDGVSGVLIPSDTETLADNLAKNIVQFYNNDDGHFGVAAKRRFKELFSNEVYGKSISQLYRNIINVNNK